jgi:hypothetical protein
MAITYFPPIPVNIKWGDISGSLANQTDLSNAFDTKADVDHTHESADMAVESPNGQYLKDDGTWATVDTFPGLPDASNGNVLRGQSTADIGWEASDRIAIPDDSNPNDKVVIKSYCEIQDPSSDVMARFAGSIQLTPKTSGDGVQITADADSDGKTLSVNSYQDGEAVYGNAYVNGIGGCFGSDGGTAIKGWTYGTANLLRLENSGTWKLLVNNNGDLSLSNLSGTGTRNVQVDNGGKFTVVGKSAAIADVTETGSAEDSTARAKINDILAVLRTHNLIET